MVTIHHITCDVVLVLFTVHDVIHDRFLLQLFDLLLDNSSGKLLRPHGLHSLGNLRPLLVVELHLHVDLRRLETFDLSSLQSGIYAEE